MSKFSRRAGKRDAIEKPCHAIALKHGWDGEQMDKFDYVYWRGLDVLLIEYKTGNAKHTKAQVALLDRKCPLVTIRSEQDAEGVFE